MIKEKMIFIKEQTFFFVKFNIGDIIEVEKSVANEGYCYIYYKGEIIDYVPVSSLTDVMLYSDWLAIEREKQIKTILDD